MPISTDSPYTRERIRFERWFDTQTDCDMLRPWQVWQAARADMVARVPMDPLNIEELFDAVNA